MIGVLVIVVVLLLIPVGFLVSMTFVAGALGWSLTADAEARHAKSELLDCNY